MFIGMNEIVRVPENLLFPLSLSVQMLQRCREHVMTVSAMLQLTPDIFIHAILCGLVNMKIAKQIKPSFTLHASITISWEKRYLQGCEM